jgi:hypothetical protein
MKKIAFLLIALSVSRADALDAKFSWSFGDFGWSWDFINGYDIAEGNFVKFNVSFEKLNTALGVSLLFAENKNNRADDEPFYNSFLPLEIVYMPFKGKYANASLYGRAAWETGYTGGVDDPRQVSQGFYGAAGIGIGLFPIPRNIFGYSGNMLTVFSEYTTHHSWKAGARIDLYDILYFALSLWAIGTLENTYPKEIRN